MKLLVNKKFVRNFDFSFLNQIAQLKDEINRFKNQIISLENNNSLINDMQVDVGHVRSQLEKLLVNLTVVDCDVFMFSQ